MNRADPTSCTELETLLVDYVDGVLERAAIDRVERHCASCDGCGAVVVALREVPARVCAEVDVSGTASTPAFWEEQRRSILARIGELDAVEAARNQGFDVRIFLPLVAAVLIALAGVVSLQSLGGGGVGTKPARAALVLAMQDPVLNAELAEVLGVSLVFSERSSSDEEIPWDGELWRDLGLLGAAPSLEDLNEAELDELEEILGVEIDA